jgi:ribosomal protein S18 acetylase RimI-like enzyme
VIEEVRDANDDVTEALNRLLPQLTSSGATVDRDAVERLVTSETTRLFVARNDAGHIVGMLTLVVFFIPSGMRARIEDVVVDSSARGQGHGDALTRAALEVATSLGARSVDLTSRPSREAANRIYRRIGFAERDSKVYRYRP